MLRLRLCRAVGALFFLLAALTSLAAAELNPIGPGPYAVGSTNLAAEPRSVVPMADLLNGQVIAGHTVYLTDVLTHPKDVPTVTITVPDRPGLFGAQAGTRLPTVLCILYPTPRDNPRPDYAFPFSDTGDNVLPHMQRAGERPLFADPGTRHPLIVVSGGYMTNPLWHLDHLKLLASHGYIVADIAHGDGRGNSLAGNLALRGLELRATIDWLLHDPNFGPAIDAGRIGAAGQSAGGYTVLAAMGGVDPSGRIPPLADPRIKAGFGLVPFMGGTGGFWPFRVDLWFFGKDHAGLRPVRAPFLAVYGAKDRNIPPAGIEEGVRALSGPATAVELDGQTHSLSEAAKRDAYTWELLFFDAWLRGDAAARHKLESGTSVRGGVHDHKTIQHGARPE